MYEVLTSDITLEKIKAYKAKLIEGKQPGRCFEALLRCYEIEDLEDEEFLEILVNTKKPQIFAESAVFGDGSDWNNEELSILGDVGFAVPVTIFDNGQHRAPYIHYSPLKGHLLFIPGALLNSRTGTPADWNEVVESNEINQEKYTELYNRRLLPLFKYANEIAGSRNRKAFITIPGLGCGQFAGQFRGYLGEALQNALQEILRKNCHHLKNVRAVYYDPYLECQNDRFQYDQISLLVRPLTEGNEGKSQLSELSSFNELDDDFSDCEFFSVVAWDHVSWPGNDYYTGARCTDDGVKAAATDSMYVLSNVEGYYDYNRWMYRPPDEYVCWKEVVRENDITLHVYDNLKVYSTC